MKKLICILVAVFAMSITSSALETIETDYANIKNAVLMYVASCEYQKAIECIDLYGYTVQNNDWYYNDLQNDRVAIAEVMHANAFTETVEMLQTLSRLKRYELALIYIDEQKIVFADCPNFIKQLNEWQNYFDAKTKASVFSGMYQGDGVTMVTSVDTEGTVVELLTIQKEETTIVLADEQTRGFIYTWPNAEYKAEGAYYDNLQNAGMIYAACDEYGTVVLEITSDDYNKINPAGIYKLIKQ